MIGHTCVSGLAVLSLPPLDNLRGVKSMRDVIDPRVHNGLSDAYHLDLLRAPTSKEKMDTDAY